MRTDYLSLLGIALAGVSNQAMEASKLFLIQKGPMVLKPQFQTTAVFNDNINYRDENKISDFSAIVSPGFKLQLGARDYNYLELSYLFDRVQYLQENDFDANQHHVVLESHFQKSRFLLEGQDSIESLSSPLGGGISLQGQLVERLTIVDNYRLTYDLSQRTGIYIGATHSSADYQNDIPLFDTRSLIGTLGFVYKGFSRTFFFGEIYYGQTKNEPSVPTLGEYPTASFIGGFVGVRGNFTENLSGTVKGGYEVRNYDDDTEGSEAPVVEASLTQRIFEGTVASIFYSRRQQESVQFVRSTYVSDILSATLTQDIGADGRLRATLNGGYYMYNYEFTRAGGRFEDRSDDLLLFGLTFSYDVKLWMRILAGYTFERLASNESSVIDYTVNRVTLGLELGY